MAEITPMMKQFFDLKAKHPDAILLFRCGDFYETYSNDAVEAADILGITLTKRNNGGREGEPIAMAGFPYHALDTYLPKLVRAGRRVAICDQLEDPKLTKKLVKRGITELVTPGVAMNDNVLNYKENNFLAAVHFGKTACGVAFLDISTGEFLTGEGSFDYVDKLLGNFQPKEVLYDRSKKQQFEQQNAYEHISKFLLPKLTENGMILLVDVTTYNNTSKEWLPMMMDRGIMAANCYIVERNQGYNQTYSISHSLMAKDDSKIAWRIIKK